MAEKLYVITATDVKETGEATFSFMFKSKSPFKEYRDVSGKYGMVKLREKGENEVNPFKLARGEPGAIGPDGKLKWQVYVGSSGSGQLFTGHVDECPPEEKGLQELLEGIPDCVLLIPRDLFDRFQAACENADIELGAHHFDGELSTS